MKEYFYCGKAVEFLKTLVYLSATNAKVITTKVPTAKTKWYVVTAWVLMTLINAPNLLKNVPIVHLPITNIIKIMMSLMKVVILFAQPTNTCWKLCGAK